MSKYTCIVLVFLISCFTIVSVSKDITKAAINCNQK